MSDSESPNDRSENSIPEGGILAALPRARPQRASPRRVAARSAAGQATTRTSKTTKATKVKKPTHARGAPPKTKITTEKTTPAKKTATTKTVATKKTAAKAKPPITQGPTPAGKRTATKKRMATRRPIAKPTESRAPKQGYEPEEEVEVGSTVNPPSGAELVESVADILGEIANSGLTAGGRILKDAFSLLRRP